MNIRAKFRVHHIEKHDDVNWPYENVFMSPVYSDDPNSENRSFSKATPSGQINLTITNTASFGAFVEGKEYYIDFTPAG